MPLERQLKTAPLVKQLLTHRQRHAFLLRHADKLSDAQAAAVMGFAGRRPGKKFNRLVRRAERMVEGLKKLAADLDGEADLVDEMIAQYTAVRTKRKHLRGLDLADG